MIVVNLSTDIKDIQMSDTKVVSPYLVQASETEVDEISSSMGSANHPTPSTTSVAKFSNDPPSPSSRSNFGGKSLVRSRSQATHPVIVLALLIIII